MLDHPDSGGVQTGWLNRLIHHCWFTDNKPSYTYLIFQLNDQSLTGAAAAVLLNYSSSYLHIVGRSVVRVQTIWIIVVLSGNSMETYESSWVFPRRTQWRRVLEVSRLLISCLLSWASDWLYSKKFAVCGPVVFSGGIQKWTVSISHSGQPAWTS